jgi:hypothetical protein
VWGRRCPHVVDALNRDGDRCRDEHRFARARAAYEEVLARDPRDFHARFESARLALRYGDEPGGRAELDRLAREETAPRTWRDRAEEALADGDLLQGRDDAAVAAYRALAERVLDEDVRRTLQVKIESVAQPEARRAVLDLLVGETGRPADSWIGAVSLGVWAEDSRDALAAYLIGKNLAQHDRYARAAIWLDRALDPSARPLPSLPPPVARELLRQRAVCACAVGDRAGLERIQSRLEAPDSPFSASVGSGRKEWILRLIARCGS